MIEVQARKSASTKRGQKDASKNSINVDALLVRSTASPLWVTYPSSLGPGRDGKGEKLLPGEWEMEDACVLYGNLSRRPSAWSYLNRRHLLVQGHRSSRTLLWPVAVPSIYTEGSAWSRSRVLNPFPERRLHEWNCSWQSRASAAFVLHITIDNLFHTLFHAVPLRERLEQLRTRQWAGPTSGAEHIVPLFETWPHSTEGTKPDKPAHAWVGLQVAVRALQLADSWEAVAAQMDEVSMPDRCTCYSRLAGGHRPYNPMAGFGSTSVWRREQMREHKARLISFRRAWSGEASSMTLPFATHQGQLIFQLRAQGNRNIINVLELQRFVAYPSSRS